MVIVIVFADRGKARAFFGWINSFPLGDKAGHFFLIGVMALLLNYALAHRTAPINRAHLQLGGLIVAVVITFEVLSQLWLLSRTFDVGDLLANWLGVLVAELLARVRAG